VSTFAVEIETTFLPESGAECDQAVAGILRDIADKLEGGDRGLVIHHNGVRVGDWGYKPPPKA
jgi:hypothetical protein